MGYFCKYLGSLVISAHVTGKAVNGSSVGDYFQQWINTCLDHWVPTIEHFASISRNSK